MAIGTVIKRIFQSLGCLWLAGVLLYAGVQSYFEGSPEAQERIKVAAKDAEMRVDEDASFTAKVSALIAAWWEADELVEEDRREKALDNEAKEQRRKESESRQFNDTSYDYNDDYYPSGN